jgi:ABC-type oligopeptide transport system substrate-binding subunit
MNQFLKALLTIICFAVGFTFMIKPNKTEESLSFSTSSRPFSSDPIDYDYYIHHYAFTSVFGKLVSLERKGVVSPILAEQWSHNTDFTIWTFNIRENLYYSNGDKIIAQDIEKNFKRIAFLKNKSKSNSGLVEFLLGFNKMLSPQSEFEGISVNNNKIVFKFSKAMPDLLSKISFGFYSLAHPSLYDSKTGDWINKMNVISSGAYEVSTWNDKDFILKLRPNIPYVNYDKSINSISFKNLLEVKKTEDLKFTDIVVADKNSLMVDESFQYTGSSVGLKIGYAQLYGWNHKKALKDSNVRKWLRNKFYEGLEQNGFKPTYSFFPLSLKGLKVQNYSSSFPAPKIDNFELVTHTMDQTSKLIENRNTKSMSEIFDLALSNLNGNGVALIKKPINDDSNLDGFDLVINGTGIEASEYWDTVRFMFLSKQGIQLPDETGVVLNELKKINPDINLINNEIWNQAIIWPIRHYTNGFWFKKESRLNFDEINLDNPAIDFQFFKWN